MSDKSHDTAPLEEGVIVTVDPDAIEVPVERPQLPYNEVFLAYRMLMGGIISRLYLYLYGEFERIDVETALQSVEESDEVYREILLNKVPPKRAIYEYLIKQEVIKREELGEIANAYLDEQDDLQYRITPESEEAVDGPRPTYTAETEVNVGCDSEDPLGGGDTTGLVVWGQKTESAEGSVLSEQLDQTWAKIHLNGDIRPGIHSRYTLLYDPNKKLGE